MSTSEHTSPVSARSYNAALVDLSLLVVRVVVGVIFFAHGAQKLFGLWGGMGLSKTVEMMGVMGYPVSVGECLGGIGIIFGFLSRFSAASNIVIMLGAIAMVHGQNGFFASDQGFEYNLALIGLLTPILILGPGAFSIAGCFYPRSPRTGRPNVFLE